jgi:three-Cys-motif partner protein
MDVRLHSKIKHRIIAYYFGVWKNVFKSPKIYSLVYADLFAGDGVCVCDEMPPGLSKKYPEDCLSVWKPPYFSLMDYAREANFNLKCVFNDYNAETVKKLKENLTGYEKFVDGRVCEDANTAYSEVLKIIGKPNRPSLFFLDPFFHDQLPFSTIEGIAKFKSDNGRKPELIINLMVEPMLMALKRGTEKDFSSITKSLGTDEWRDKLGQGTYKGKSHVLFHDIFKRQIESLGYKTTSYYIYSTQNRSPMYFLFFATFNDQVHKLHKQIKPQIDALQKKEWVKENFQIQEIVNNLGDGRQKGLFEE